MDPWEVGDYEVVGDWFAAASRSVLDTDGPPERLDGSGVLDVACGTGAVAIEAARRGATVLGVDNSPTMLDVASRRAIAAGVDVGWERRSFDDLSGIGTWSMVTSSFGAMFAADPVAMATELDRAASSDGTVAVTAWHPAGAFGGGPPELTDLVGPPPIDVTRWADPDQVASFFAATGRTIAHHRRDVAWIEHPSIEVAVAQMREHSGPWIALFAYLEELGEAETGARALTEHLTSRSKPVPGGVALRAEYTVTHLRRS